MTTPDGDASIILKPPNHIRREGILNNGFDSSQMPENAFNNSPHSSITARRVRRVSIMQPENENVDNEQRDSITSLGTPRRSLTPNELALQLKELRRGSQYSERLKAFTVHALSEISEQQRKTMAEYSSFNYAPAHSQSYTNWLLVHPTKWDWDRWVVMLMIGLATGILAFLMSQFLTLLSNIKWDESRRLAETNLGLCWLWTAGISILYILVSSGLVAFVHPPAGGAGVPEVMAYLNGIIVHKTMSLKNLIVKFLSNVLAVSSGLPVATQGPVIMMGRNFTTAGVAAGVAAAFDAPIGGILFAIEDISSFWSKKLSWQTFFCCVISTTTAALLKNAFSAFTYQGNFGLLGVLAAQPLQLNIIMFVPAILLGLIGGCLGALFTRLNIFFAKSRAKILSKISHPLTKKIVRIMEPVFLGVIMATFAVLLPLGFQCDVDPVNDNITKTVEYCFPGSGIKLISYRCPKTNDNATTQYNEVATLLMSPGTAMLQKLVSRNTHYVFNYGPVLSILPWYLFFTTWSAGSAVAGGIFVPNLIIGSLYGRAVGVACLKIYSVIKGVNEAVPSEKYWQWIDPGALAVLGAGSMLGGVTRLTLAVSVIVAEMVQDVNLVLPVCISICVAKWIGDLLSAPLMKQNLKIKAIPYLGAEPVVVKEGQILNLELYTAASIMHSPVKTLHHRESVHHLAKLLLETEHGGFPVIRWDAETKFDLACGSISRTVLFVILCSEEVYNAEYKYGCTITPEVEYEKVSVDYISDYSASLERVRTYYKFPQYQQIYVNLEAYINTSCYRIDEEFSLHRTYTLFRTMGLKQLVVVDKQNRVKGIITRKDLMEFNLREKLVGKTALLISSVDQQHIEEEEEEDTGSHSSEGDIVLPAITKTLSILPGTKENGWVNKDKNDRDISVPNDPIYSTKL